MSAFPDLVLHAPKRGEPQGDAGDRVLKIPFSEGRIVPRIPRPLERPRPSALEFYALQCIEAPLNLSVMFDRWFSQGYLPLVVMVSSVRTGAFRSRFPTLPKAAKMWRIMLNRLKIICHLPIGSGHFVPAGMGLGQLKRLAMSVDSNI